MGEYLEISIEWNKSSGWEASINKKGQIVLRPYKVVSGTHEAICKICKTANELEG